MSRRQFIGAAAAALAGLGAAILARSQAAFAGTVPLLADPFDLGDGGTTFLTGGWDALSGISESGRQTIRNFEGLRLTSYQDAGGTWTIGYGHTGPDVTAGMTTTAVQAEAWLRDDVAAAEDAVRSLVSVVLSQAQFDALVSFVYNVGSGNFSRSTLLAKLNAGDYAGAADEFSKWTYANGVSLGGLATRRAREAALFRSGTAA